MTQATEPAWQPAPAHGRRFAEIRGHAALPDGFGLPADDGSTERTGIALDTLTDLRRRDPIAGTLWHQHLPTRVEPLPA